jgi:hypothetical protein
MAIRQPNFRHRQLRSGSIEPCCLPPSLDGIGRNRDSANCPRLVIAEGISRIDQVPSHGCEGQDLMKTISRKSVPCCGFPRILRSSGEVRLGLAPGLGQTHGEVSVRDHSIPPCSPRSCKASARDQDPLYWRTAEDKATRPHRSPLPTSACGLPTGTGLPRFYHCNPPDMRRSGNSGLEREAA